MDKISDFFKELMSRLRNPLISSFIIAWLVINWRVVIGLFFYNQSQLHVDHYDSYIDLIEKNDKTGNYLWKPLGFAIVYTGFFPVVRTWIMALHTRIDKWGTGWYLKISKDGYIPVTKYIDLSDDLKLKITQIQKLINAESEIINQKNSLQLDLSTERSQRQDLTMQYNDLSYQLTSKQKEVDILRAKNNIQFFDGNWAISYGGLLTDKPDKGDIKISNGEASLLDKDGVFFRIEYCSFNPNKNEFTLHIHFLSVLNESRDWEVFSSKLSDNSLMMNMNQTTIRKMNKLPD